MTRYFPPFEIVLVWTDPSGGAESPLSTADINVRVNGETIWPVAGEFDTVVDVFVDDLLAHLTEYWKPLLLRQTYPVKVTPDRPTSLRRVAEGRWDELPRAIVENEESRVSAFEDAHDLSRAFAGQFGLPPLYLLRSGQSLIVDTGDELRTVAFESAREALSNAGDAIAQRLSGDDKWAHLIKAWKARDEGAPEQLLAWSTSLKPSLATQLVREGALLAPQTVQEAANDDNELRLAARMAAPYPNRSFERSSNSSVLLSGAMLHNSTSSRDRFPRTSARASPTNVRSFKEKPPLLFSANNSTWLRCSGSKSLSSLSNWESLYIRRRSNPEL